MKKGSVLLAFAMACVLTSVSRASEEKLPTALTPAEIAREAQDAQRYPVFMGYLKTVDISPRLFPTDPHNAKFIPTSKYFDPSLEMWSGFFKAAAADHLTCLRAFGLLSREIKKRGYVVWGSGQAFEDAVKNTHVDLGLALPARNIGAAVWVPDPSNKDPEFQLHMTLFYTEPYVHQFPDEILPANLKIGYGEEAAYYYGGKAFHQHTVNTDLYYGDKEGVGFRNIKGIGGQKRGFLGFMQKVLFFLPDAISSMTIDEKSGSMVTEAMVNTTVKNFETNRLYSVKIKE